MSGKQQQTGWTVLGALGVVAFGLLGAALTSLLTGPSLSPPAPPWTFITILLLPLTMAVSVLARLGELKALDGLSRSEQRRLDDRIAVKRRQVAVAISFYLASALFLGIAFYGASSAGAAAMLPMPLVVRIAGGLDGVALFSVGLLLLEMHEVEDFRGALSRRANSDKSKAAALSRLRPPPAPGQQP